MLTRMNVYIVRFRTKINWKLKLLVTDHIRMTIAGFRHELQLWIPKVAQLLYIGESNAQNEADD